MSYGRILLTLLILSLLAACSDSGAQTTPTAQRASHATSTPATSPSIEPDGAPAEVAGNECAVAPGEDYWDGASFAGEPVFSSQCGISQAAHDTFRACGLRDEHIREIVDQHVSSRREFYGEESGMVLSILGAPDATPSWSRYYGAQTLASGIYLVSCNSVTSSPTPTIQPTVGVKQAKLLPEIAVTSNSNASPDGCGPGEIARLVVDFFDAYNRGAEEELANFFEPTFQWYSDSITPNQPTDEDNSLTTSNRSDLLEYFVERHEQHERLRLISIDTRYDGDRGLIQVSYLLIRQADDYKTGPDGPERLVFGKGAILCPAKKIFVWSIGDPVDTEDQPPFGPLCPEPPIGTSRDAVIAC